MTLVPPKRELREQTQIMWKSECWVSYLIWLLGHLYMVQAAATLPLKTVCFGKWKRSCLIWIVTHEFEIFSLISFAAASFNLLHLPCYIRGIAIHWRQPVCYLDNNYFSMRYLYDIWYFGLKLLTVHFTLIILWHVTLSKANSDSQHMLSVDHWAIQYVNGKSFSSWAS